MTSVLGVLTSPAATAVRVLPLLADAAIKGMVIFGVAAIAVTLCRRRSAATRHAIWAGAVVAQLALPVLSGFLPAWRVPLVDRLDEGFAMDVRGSFALPDGNVIVAAEMPPAMPVIVGSGGGVGRGMSPDRLARIVARGEARAARAGAMGFGGAVGRPYAVIESPYVVRQTLASRIWSGLRSIRGRNTQWWIRAVGLLWLIGAVGIFTRFVAGTVAVSRLARRSERVDDGRWLSLAQRIAVRLGVARPMTLLRSGRFDVPVTWGIVYPVVLLPDGADEWTDDRRRYVLVHEMAHVKRVDAFTQLVAQFAIALFWFDPFVWIAAHRMRVEREHACDDYVLREGTPASTYAADLLAMVRSLGTRGRSAQPAFAALAMARPDELETRMDAILDPKTDRRSLRNAPTLGFALCSLLLLLPLAAFKPWGARRSRGYAMPVRIEHAMPDLSGLEAQLREMPAHLQEMNAALADMSSAHAASAAASAAAASAAVVAVAASASDVATSALPVIAAMPAMATRASSWSSGSIASCSSVSLKRSGTSTSIHSSSDDDDTSFQYISSSSGRCLQVAVWGRVEFASDEHSIRSVSRDGRFYVRERRPNVDREVEVTAGEENAPRYAYSVNGERASFDDDGQEWLENLLPEILRESGLNAREHVARLRKEGGVSAVLADISRIESTSAKRAAYEALLHQGGLSDDDAAEIARQAGRDLSSSDGELRAVLAQIGAMDHAQHSPRMAEAFGDAVEHMSSDGEKRALLQQYALRGDREMLLVAGRQAKSVSSDGEKAAFLASTADRYLATDDEGLRRVFFEVTQTISSDGEKREVLMKSLPFAARPTVLMSVLETANGISSDGEKSELLVNILRRKLLTNDGARAAFMKTTRTISSDSDFRRVMEEALTADRR
jgi:beta-lactamase regulating signal transducer with metallopeptidase domain